MALLGVSLILASLVLFLMRRPAWFPSLWGSPAPAPVGPPPQETPAAEPADRHSEADAITRQESSHDSKGANGAAAAQTPIPPPPVIQHTAPEPDASPGRSSSESTDDGQSTPKASASTLTSPVPAFALSAPEPGPPTISTPNGPNPKPSPSPSTLMPPPPRPPTLRPSPPTTTSTSPSASLLPPRGRNLPIPARGPGCSTLAPPPTHSSKPAKPSRAVVLQPGHSPLDWARLSGSPTSDLRGLPPGSPYLRVTPSMLKKMTGRRGKDAWTVLGGKVYNMSPYLPFHPGGEPELLRGAGRDGTKLFGEVHPWVNYEGMLAACLVGIFVPEGEEEAGGSGGGGDMEAMD